MIKLSLLLLLLSLNSWGIETEFSGKIRFSELRPTQNFINDKTEDQGIVFLKNKTSFSENLKFSAEALGFYIQSPLILMPKKNLNRGDYFFEINELNFRYEYNGFGFKMGQQTTSWGKSDGLNPTDFLSGRRNVLMGAEDIHTRRGHTSAMVEYVPNEGNSSWNFQQWVVFRHATTDILINKRLAGNSVEIVSEERRENFEFATKFGYQGVGWEAEYIYFYGINKTPLFLGSLSSLSPVKVKLNPHYVRQEGYGINLVKDFTNFVFRLESAFVRRLDIKESDFLHDPDRVDVVLGIEKSFFETHRFNFQIVGHHFLEYQKKKHPDPILTQIKYINSIVQAQHQQTRLGHLITYQFEPSELNQWKFKLNWLNYLYRESASVFSPQIDYEINSSFNAEFFAILFNGEKRTQFGVLNDLSSLGAAISYQF